MGTTLRDITKDTFKECIGRKVREDPHFVAHNGVSIVQAGSGVVGVQANSPAAARIWASCGYAVGTMPRAQPDGTVSYDLANSLA
jgi:hypothetical protein